MQFDTHGVGDHMEILQTEWNNTFHFCLEISPFVYTITFLLVNSQFVSYVFRQLDLGSEMRLQMKVLGLLIPLE